MKKLSELQPGQRGYIVKVNGHGGFRKRIVEMGFIKGKPVDVLQAAPLNDPVTYKIMGYEVSLRRNVSEQIEVISPEEVEMEFWKNNISNSYNGTLSEDDFRRVALEKRKEINVALVGNPNSGKSTLFNAVTGLHVKVGNYSGVTVDVKTGNCSYKGYKFNFTDLPGTYSISFFSPEERLVREHIVNKKPDVVLNVIDSGNLERNMYLTTQLVDMNLRSIIALNFYDEFEQRGDILDIDTLSKLIGIPIVPTVAAKKEGIEELLDSIINLYEGADIIDRDGKLIAAIEDDELIERYHHLIELEHRHSKKNSLVEDIIGDKHLHEIVRHIHINYGSVIEKSINRLKNNFYENEMIYYSFTPRYIALQLLQRDKDVEGFIARFSNYAQIIQIRDEEEKRIETELKSSPVNAVMDAKYGFIAGALKETYQKTQKEETFTPTSKIDKIVTNKYLAYPVFAVIIYLMFQATFIIGEYPMGWIELGVEYISGLLSSVMPDGIFEDMLIDGVIGGVGAVIVFLPNILILYFCMTLLEASGYMARAAFIMDRLMHKIGLHGRSFIPLMMGFGCSVPAIMATRTIENRNARMTTILITTFASCSARLPVYILLIGTFFAKHQALVLFAIYFTGIAIACVVAKIFKKTFFKKEEMPFVMELPKYRIPQIKYVLRDTWDKGYQYLKKIGTTILVGSIVIWALAYFPLSVDGDAVSQMENSYLASIGKTIEPVLRPLGFDWKISVAILTGGAAKEVVVSTLGVLYQVDEGDIESSLPQKLQEATYQDGSPIYTTSTVISFLLFILLYFPCIAAISTVKNETGSWWWALFEIVYTTLLAWIVAFIAYNIISYGIIQEVVVAAIILLCLFYILRRLFAGKNNKSGCKGCCMCNS